MLVGGRNKFGSTENEVISAHVPVCISNQVLGPHPWPYPLTIPAFVLTTLARYSPVPRYIIWIFYSTDISMKLCLISRATSVCWVLASKTVSWLYWNLSNAQVPEWRVIEDFEREKSYQRLFWPDLQGEVTYHWQEASGSESEEDSRSCKANFVTRYCLISFCTTPGGSTPFRANELLSHGVQFHELKTWLILRSGRLIDRILCGISPLAWQESEDKITDVVPHLSLVSNIITREEKTRLTKPRSRTSS